MAQVAGIVASELEQLGRRVQELENRVAVLEGEAALRNVVPLQFAGAQLPERPQSQSIWQVLPLADLSGGVVPVLGKAVLGMSGAFLLRAVAESSAVPILPVLFVAIVYAVLWMVWAARIHRTDPFASATFAVTSAMILSPMLCECTLRFQVLSATLAAVALVAFVVTALALARPQKLQLIPSVATLVSVGTVLVLILGTHALVPLTTALLAIALAIEASAWLGQRLRARAVPALAADLSVWLLVYIMTSSEGVPEGYHPVSAAAIVALCLGLLAIYGASIGANNFGLRRRITFFDIGQGIVAFALAIFGTMRTGYTSAAVGLGALLLLLAAVCYWGALSRFAEEPHAHNRRVTATLAAVQLVAGSYLLFSANLLVAFLCVAAVAAVMIYNRTVKLTLGLHATVYLAVAAAFSALPVYARDALAGTVPAVPHWSLWVVVLSAALCYALGSRGAKDRGMRRLLWVLPAALVGFAGAALLVAATVGLSASRMELSSSRLAAIRTVVNCVLAFSLGFLASRWKRVELGWLAYVAVAFGSLKLFVEDLRYGNPASLMVSLLFYGMILILLPRFMRHGRTDPI